MAVDIVLFPIDTIKTRIQATIHGQTNYAKATNSKFSGLKSQIIGSFPSAAAFFSTYDLTKHIFIKRLDIKYHTLAHMLAAIAGECSAALIRNPFELVKQNLQIGRYNHIIEAVSDIYCKNGVRGLYRGYVITVTREIPFGLIQYPLYEYLKKLKGKQESPFSYSICGAQAGAIAAFLTTPIDVVKTRIMTANDLSFRHAITTAKLIYNNEGLTKFYSGVHLRVLYISIGGLFFFGVNEYFKDFLGFQTNVIN
jgi:solute carrier family 25 S-adenosylmethionine transporter 26